ncbi:hypothetical protein C8F01DRAFT_1183336 [Mycena amicta]|nr:hypothetical protein C8F01DRAFT_1183336 [Mycena amicta]
MNLDLYLEMRMLTVTVFMKQFLSHSDPTVLNAAAQAMKYLFSAISLSNTNSTKILELEDELSSLSATLRLAVLGTTRALAPARNSESSYKGNSLSNESSAQRVTRQQVWRWGSYIEKGDAARQGGFLACYCCP